MELRPYQQEAKDAIFEQWDSGVLKTLLVLPTGCGKTVVFAKVTEDCVRQGSRVLILAHRGELLDQAADKLKKTTGLGCAVEKAESSCQGTWFRVVVGSVQTLMREKRLSSFDSDYFDTIIIDEAHHCISDSYQRVLQHFSGAHVLGVTATPDRGDMKNLGTYFESLAYEYTLPKAIKEGYLSPIKALTIPLKIDMSSVSVQAGDFKASDISTACRELDGKTFLVSQRQAGKNHPPMHPWCRSTTISVIDDETLSKMTRAAYNPETGRTERVPANMTYKEWYEKYVKGNAKAEAQEKAVKNVFSDRKQFDKYREILGKDMPKDFADFQEMKYNSPEEWELLRTYARSVKNGMISPLSGFKNYQKIYGEINEKVVGIKTSEGTAVTRQSKHFMERVIGTMRDPKTGRPRSGVTVEGIQDALEKPVIVRAIRTDSQGGRSQKYIGEKTTVSVDPDTGILIQCNPTNERLLRSIQNGKV